MLDFVFNVLALVVFFVVTRWLTAFCETLVYDLGTGLKWRWRGVLLRPSALGLLRHALLAALVAVGPLALVAWLLSRFAPSLLTWPLERWGAWSGIGLGLALFLLEWGLGRRGKLRDLAAQFYDDNSDEIPEQLSIRQATYLKSFRQAWESWREEQDADDAADGEEQDDVGDLATEPPPRLEFEILEVSRKRQVTDAPPYNASGGDWTVLSCRTVSPSAAAFVFAERSGEAGAETGMAWGEARLWVPTPQDGARLAQAVAEVFPFEDQATPPPEAPSVPVVDFNTVVLSRRTRPRADGSFGGEGNWTASKWFYEEGTEFYVNWSAEEGRGWFREKDELFREDLHRAFASLA